MDGLGEDMGGWCLSGPGQREEKVWSIHMVPATSETHRGQTDAAPEAYLLRPTPT